MLGEQDILLTSVKCIYDQLQNFSKWELDLITFLTEGTIPDINLIQFDFPRVTFDDIAIKSTKSFSLNVIRTIRETVKEYRKEKIKKFFESDTGPSSDGLFLLLATEFWSKACKIDPNKMRATLPHINSDDINSMIPHVLDNNKSKTRKFKKLYNFFIGSNEPVKIPTPISSWNEKYGIVSVKTIRATHKAIHMRTKSRVQKLRKWLMSFRVYLAFLVGAGRPFFHSGKEQALDDLLIWVLETDDAEQRLSDICRGENINNISA